ncbi:MAG: glycoside hydrolase family 13 protein [Firmicutes bacterium]|nr:glycoside hydrolase family 13 protein [Bacillota bacterium]
MAPYYFPLDPVCRSVAGGIEAGSKITFRVFAENAVRCEFLLREEKTGETQSFFMERRDGAFECTVQPEKIGLYWYLFSVDGRLFGSDGKLFGSFSDPGEYLLLVYRRGFVTPDWIKGGIIYQIFPDRFYKVGNLPIESGKRLRSDWGGIPDYLPDESGEIQNNDFFGGNLRGIIEKLPYLSSLCVKAIYLNPVFRAYSNHRYDTADYHAIDPLLGTAEDFGALVGEAEEYGIRLILDGVFNHTGADSIYFNRYGNYASVGAYQSKDSPYAEWYEFFDYPDGYSAWWGIRTLPAIRKDCKAFQQFIAGENGVLSEYEAGGWRLDVADELSSDFVRQIRSAIKEKNPENLLIGEVWEDAAEKIAYGERKPYFCGEELDSVTNYPLKDAVIRFVKYGDAQALSRTMARVIDHYPKCCLDVLMNILDTHDTARILSVLGSESMPQSKAGAADRKLTAAERALAVCRLKKAVLLQFTLPGVPCVYYGDEIGMEGFGDPFNRRCFPWGEEDEEILSWYRRIAELRSEIFVFTCGTYREVFSDAFCFVFERRTAGRAVTAAVNNGDRTYLFRFGGVLFDLLTRRKLEGATELKPGEMLLLYDELL